MDGGVVDSYLNQTLLTLLSRWRIWKKIMDINNVFAGAHHVATDAAATIEKALHFEICPGGYWGTMLTVCDIGDVDAHMHYVYIEAGIGNFLSPDREKRCSKNSLRCGPCKLRELRRPKVSDDWGWP